MRPSLSSDARLRTRTGCLECRQRRKKCDERTPRCKGCNRNHLKCTWPTEINQSYDSRTSRGFLRKLQQEVQSPCRQLQLSIGTPFNSRDHSKLFAHFAGVVFPDLLRPNCEAERRGKEFFLRLAFQFPPLMGTIIAITAMRVDPLRYQRLVLESSQLTLQDLQSRLSISKDAGNEDGLLATTIFLCVFETSQRTTFRPNIGAHANAASILLSLRNAPNHPHSPQQTGAMAVFEKICAESLLYHSTLMMLFDPALDTLYISKVALTFIRHTFNGDDEPEEGAQAAQKLILDTSHKFFLLISEVTRLGRAPRPLNDDDLSPWTCLQAELSRREQDTSLEPSQLLFILAMQILLLRVYLTPSSDDIAARITALINRGLPLVETLDIRKYFPGYLLWPLAVFGSVALQDHERRSIEKTIFRLVERQYGQAVRIYDWLQRLWTMEHENEATTMMCGLQMLVDGSYSPNE